MFKNSFSFFFVKYFFKKGHSLKVASGFHSALQRLYTAVFENVAEKKKKHSNFFFIFNMLRLNMDFFNINFFLFWLLKSVRYSFFFKISVLPKFLKKKTKKKYLIEPVFLEKKKRARTSLRIFSVGILKSRFFTFKSRVYAHIADLAFNLKNSVSFKEKSLVYKKIFKLLKKKKLG